MIDTEQFKKQLFMNEILEVCKKHGYLISQQDGQGKFIVEKYNERGERWLMSADDGAYKQKYKIGDVLWFINFNEPYNAIVERICINESDINYYFNSQLSIHETKVYPTKEALIESQITYWTALKNKEKSKCEHNWLNGICVICGEGWINTPQFRKDI